MLNYNEKIVCDGQVYDGNKNNVNYSDIFSELIQAAGMGCEFYASDLFYDLESIKHSIDALMNDTFYIGIRTHGVDGESFIKSRLDRKSCGYSPNCYLKLYRVDIEVTESHIIVTLERLTEYDVEVALNIR